mmetsp:Transcript_6821/g.13363  ORF Transcript_6821/g.13363 Transcript_6821/m.13363 type:complete len:113 (+) Transcript_6821:613-951(+)
MGVHPTTIRISPVGRRVAWQYLHPTRLHTAHSAHVRQLKSAFGHGTQSDAWVTSPVGTEQVLDWLNALFLHILDSSNGNMLSLFAAALAAAIGLSMLLRFVVPSSPRTASRR